MELCIGLACAAFSIISNNNDTSIIGKAGFSISIIGCEKTSVFTSLVLFTLIFYKVV